MPHPSALPLWLRLDFILTESEDSRPWNGRGPGPCPHHEKTYSIAFDCRSVGPPSLFQKLLSPRRAGACFDGTSVDPNLPLPGSRATPRVLGRGLHRGEILLAQGPGERWGVPNLCFPCIRLNTPHCPSAGQCMSTGGGLWSE